MIGLRRALILIAIAALAAGLIVVPVILTSDHEPAKIPLLLATLVIGWSFVGTGVYAWWRRPRNEIGVLMTLTGFFWILPALSASDVTWVFGLGSALSAVSLGFLVHLLLVFPDGRLRTRLERWVVTTTYVVVTVLQLPGLVFADTQDPDICGPDCPANPLRPENSDFAFVFFSSFQALVGILAITGLIVALVRRWRRWNESTRKAFAPVLWAGGRCSFSRGCCWPRTCSLRSDTGRVGHLRHLPCSRWWRFRTPSWPGCCRPGSHGRGRSANWSPRSPGERESRVDLRAAISEALGDPDLEIALWVPDRGGYVDRPAGRSRSPRTAIAAPWSSTTADGSGRWSTAPRLEDPRNGQDPGRGRGTQPRKPATRGGAPLQRCTSSGPRGRGWSKPATPSGPGSSATSTTAPSSGWSGWRSACRLAGSKLEEDPAAAGRAADRGLGRARAGHHRAARAGPGNPPGDPDRPRTRRRRSRR